MSVRVVTDVYVDANGGIRCSYGSVYSDSEITAIINSYMSNVPSISTISSLINSSIGPVEQRVTSLEADIRYIKERLLTVENDM